MKTQNKARNKQDHGGERGVQEGGDMCIPTADSC